MNHNNLAQITHLNLNYFYIDLFTFIKDFIENLFLPTKMKDSLLRKAHI